VLAAMGVYQEDVAKVGVFSLVVVLVLIGADSSRGQECNGTYIRVHSAEYVPFCFLYSFI